MAREESAGEAHRHRPQLRRLRCADCSVPCAWRSTVKLVCRFDWGQSDIRTCAPISVGRHPRSIGPLIDWRTLAWMPVVSYRAGAVAGAWRSASPNGPEAKRESGEREARGERREGRERRERRDETRETRETRDERRETRDERRETRDERRETETESDLRAAADEMLDELRRRGELLNPLLERARHPAPHKDFSDLYEKMSGRGESAVLSPGRNGDLQLRSLGDHCLARQQIFDRRPEAGPNNTVRH